MPVWGQGPRCRQRALVGFDGSGRKVDAVGLQLKGFARLIEADMTIGADAQQLQVDAAQLVDDTVVTGTLGGSVQIGAVRQVGLGRVDIHLAEQVLIHEIPVALGMLLGQAAVLVQIDGGHLRKIDVALVVPVHQLCIRAHGGAAGRQTQHAVGLHNDLCRNDIGCLAGHIRIIFCTNDLHYKRPHLSSFLPLCTGCAEHFCV